VSVLKKQLDRPRAPNSKLQLNSGLFRRVERGRGFSGKRVDSRLCALVSPAGYGHLWKHQALEYHCVRRHLVKEIRFWYTLFVFRCAVDGHRAVMLNAAKSGGIKMGEVLGLSKSVRTDLDKRDKKKRGGE
jgi:hypothetical protein